MDVAANTPASISGNDAQYYASSTDTNVLNISSKDTEYTIPNSSQSPVIMINNAQGKTFNFKGDFVTKGSNYGGVAMRAGTKGTVNFENNFSYETGNFSSSWTPILLEAQYGQTWNFKGDTTLTGFYNYEGGNSSGSAGMYGVIAGSSNNSGNDPVNNGQYSRAIFKNLNVNLSDTQQPGAGILGSLKTNPALIAGLRSIQGAHDSNTGKGNAGFIEVQETLNINLKADRGIGIYVSGNRWNRKTAAEAGPDDVLTPKVLINNSNISITKPTDKAVTTLANIWDSHGIKLGKVRNTGEGAGILESKGALVIDTTAVDGGGIKMLRNSTLKADFDGSSTKIDTAGYALQIGGADDRTKKSEFEHAGSHSAQASFKDAVFTTTGTSKDRTISKSKERKDLIFVDQGQNNTHISFSGDKTNLTAHEDGYIINVSGNYEAPSTKIYTNNYDDTGEIEGKDALDPSTVVFNAEGKGSMTGLITKDSIKTEEGQTAVADKKAELNLNLDNGFTWKLAKKGTETTALFDTTTLANNAVLDASGGDFTLEGNVVSDGGIITLVGKNKQDDFQTLTIDGNYTAKGAAKLKLNTNWDEQDKVGISETDLLHIKGNAAGETTLITFGKDNTENQISGTIKRIVDNALNTKAVIKVEGNAEKTNFVGTAQTTGAGEAQLAFREVNGVKEFYWTIDAKDNTPTPPNPGPNPGPGPKPTPKPTPDTPIVNPTVPGYVATPRVNLEMGYTTLATLHERRGENQTLAWDNCGNCGKDADAQTWGRIYGKNLELEGKERFGIDTNMFGFQIGHDFAIDRTDEGGHRLTGGYVAYNQANTDFSDKYRMENGELAKDKYTGKSKARGWSLGATHTRYAPNGSYVDLVGQISFLDNKFNARNGVTASQKGNALALSVEVGRPYALREHKTSEGVWFIEPQAQLVYQYLKLKDFKDNNTQIGGADAHHSVKGGNHHGLRARVGVRLAYNTQTAEENYRTNTFYVIANLLQDLSSSDKAVAITKNGGTDSLKERYGKTWAEIGLGGQLPLGKQTYIYGDARYERNLGGASREGYRGTIGVKYTWK